MSYHRSPAAPVRSQLAGPFNPHYQQVPFTNRDDVRDAIGNYERGIFDGRESPDGDMQQLAGLDGVLAVM